MCLARVLILRKSIKQYKELTITDIDDFIKQITLKGDKPITFPVYISPFWPEQEIVYRLSVTKMKMRK